MSYVGPSQPPEILPVERVPFPFWLPSFEIALRYLVCELIPGPHKLTNSADPSLPELHPLENDGNPCSPQAPQTSIAPL